MWEPPLALFSHLSETHNANDPEFTMGKVRNVRVWYLRPQDGRREEVAGEQNAISADVSDLVSAC